MHVILCTVLGRIAPKYYDAEQLLYLITEKEEILQSKIIAVEALNPEELCDLVLHMKADVIICGGIRKDYQQKLNGTPVRLIYNVIGQVDDVIHRFLSGKLESGDIVNETAKGRLKMRRRNFLKGLAVTGASTALTGGIGSFSKAHARRKKEDFGEIKSLKVHCISETSWFDNATLGKDIKAAGGINTNQYDVAYNEENLGGYAALVEVEALNGQITNYLLDTGWSNDWVDYVFEKDGIDKMLQNKEIDTMVISHDHIDHYFGLESTLKHQSDIKIYFPGTAMKKSFDLLKGADFSATPGCPKNSVPHTGDLVVTKPNELYKLQDGAAVVFFDCPATLQVRGENVMYFKLKDKGYVTVTGCCHPGILTLINYARRNFKDGDVNYGCYGGLHISVFENWDPKFDDIIKGMKHYNMTKIGCNHCTGWIWAEKAEQAGLPIIHGTDKNLSYKKVGSLARSKTSNVYLGNGDDIVF